MAETMSGVVLTGHGEADRLEWRDDLPVPRPGTGEVLIRVAASSVNNTDINTRIGWYNKSVRGATDAPTGDAAEGSWSGGALNFPLIQGADCCGHIAEVGARVDAARIGERIIVRALQTVPGPHGHPVTWTFGSECDGGFAQYTVARAEDALAVNCDWSDLELGTVPCAYSTAEGMLQRAGLGAEKVLITGASGGVGAAAVQLALARGAEVTTVSSAAKADALREMGASQVLDRDETPAADSFEVVVDLVGGPGFPPLLDALRPNGRYVVAGAIAGPIVELDLRTLYLRDLTLLGSTTQPDTTLPDVIELIEAGRLKPNIAQVFDLQDIHAAQAAFMAKTYIGKIALRVP